MKDFLYLTSGRIVSALSQSLIVILLSLELSGSKLALVLFFVATSAVFSSVVDSGLVTLIGLRFSNRDLEGSNEAFSWLAASQILGALVLSVLFYLGTHNQTQFLISAFFIPFWNALERILDGSNMIQLSSGSGWKVALVLAGRRVGAIALFFLLKVIFDVEVAFATSLLIASLVSLIGVPKPYISRRCLNGGTFSGVFKELKPLAVSTWVTQIRSLDVSLVGLAVGIRPSLPYSLGSRIANPILIAFSSLGNIILVRVGQFKKKRVSTIVGASYVLSIVLAMLVGLMSSSLARIAAGIWTWSNENLFWILGAVIFKTFSVGINIILGSALNASGAKGQVATINAFFVPASLLVLVLGLVCGVPIAWAALMSGAVSSFQSMVMLAKIAE